MSTASEDRDKLDALPEQCNASIEDLSACARNASPGVSQACREEISVLIANREGLRRGLLKFGDSRCLCSSCAG
jgi:hypothetical protein